MEQNGNNPDIAPNGAIEPKAPKAKKPVNKKAPKAPNEVQAAMLQDLNRMGLPTLATGGSLITWKNDLSGVESIEISKTPDKPDTFITVQGDGVAKIPEVQKRVFSFIVTAFTASPRTDRGYAYSTWLCKHAKALQKYFGEYTFRVHFAKSSIPVLQFKVEDVNKIASTFSSVLESSLKLKAPSRRTVTRKEQKDDKYDLVIL